MNTKDWLMRYKLTLWYIAVVVTLLFFVQVADLLWD